MELKQPCKVYTAENNMEAIMIVEMLKTQGLTAFVEEDQSILSLWALGTLTQFHQPNVWVEEAAAPQAAAFIREYEERRWERAHPDPGTSQIEALCEECGGVSTFPDSLNGTVQDCPHCGAYVDVGRVDVDTEIEDAGMDDAKE